MTTVMFTCSGQRVDVVQAFKRAGATTVAIDCNPLAPSLYHADVMLTPPRHDDPAYVPFVADAVQRYGVGLIVPLTDLDQLALSRHRESLGALVLLPEPETIELTLDKYRAHRFFLEHGIASPPTWLPEELPGEIPFPVLVKSRRGSASRDIYRADDADQLAFFLRYTRVPSMIQAVCAGEEFSIDVFCDRDSRCLAAIPRTMIESKGGESIRGMSIKDWSLIEVGCTVAETLGIQGPANVQCFRTSEGRHEVTDVNARFGGGFPVPLAAGGGYPALALALARGERPEPRLGDFREGVFMTRFFWQVCLEDAGADGLVPVTDGLPGAATVGRP